MGWRRSRRERHASERELHSAVGSDAQRRRDGAHSLQTAQQQLSPRHGNHLRPGLHGRAVHPHVIDLGAGSESYPSAVSVRGSYRERRRARLCASLSPRQEPVASAESQRERRVRDPVRGAPRRSGDDVSGVHQEIATIPAAKCEEGTGGGARTVRRQAAAGRWERVAGSRVQVLFAVATLAVFAAVPRVHTQTVPAAGRPAWAWKPTLAAANDGQVHILPVRGRVSMLIGAGGNITVSTGSDGVLVVDTGAAAMSDKVLAAIKSISPRAV